MTGIGNTCSCLFNICFSFLMKLFCKTFSPPPPLVQASGSNCPSPSQASGKDATKDPLCQYKRVAVVENFYDIIYNVHVEMDGRSGRHAGQKRTYRAVSTLEVAFSSFLSSHLLLMFFSLLFSFLPSLFATCKTKLTHRRWPKCTLFYPVKQ